jgi:phosphotransferase system enzyme I (PtsP)
MLETLHRIVHEVNAAPNLEAATQIIVRQVRKAVQSDVCSVYLTDFERRKHVLHATEGLRPDAVGKVELPLHRGLIGLVSERAEPINLGDAPLHPRYLYAEESGEEHYHGFLGVPIIQNRRVLGVLVVQRREPREFDENEVTFLFTLAAQLAGAITHARASGELQAVHEGEEVPRHSLRGRPGANGVGLGRVVVVYPMADLNVIPDRPAEHQEQEIASFLGAVKAVREDLEALEKRMESDLPAEDGALFQAWILMLESDSLTNTTIERISEGNWAAGSLRHTIEEHARIFESMDDSYLRERASDVRDLGRRILMYLQSGTPRAYAYPENTILVGEELSAVQLAEVPSDRLAGVVSATGSSASHVAILARALGVPAVMGISGLPSGLMEGREVIVDGYRGRVYVSPEPSVLEEYQRLAEGERKLSVELDALRGLPSETTDGIHVPLHLNTGLLSEMSTLGTEESEGVGLYRTELPFMVRDRFPGEGVQVTNYRKVLETFAPRPVTLRTLDVGGDKPLPYFPVRESNPFLGWRGSRISLDHPEIFLTQVRAMLRAGIGFDRMRIMLPMISILSEVDELMLLIHRAHDELEEEGFAVTMPMVGVMVEVPALIYQVEALARRVDFLSIGSNDLTQYLLAVDRNNPNVAEIFDDMHPAVLHALSHVVEGARVYSRPVSICGELAGNPLAAPLLVGMGMNCLSMSAGGLLRVKWVIRSFSRPQLRRFLQVALRMEDGKQVRRFMEGVLEENGLGGLVRPGK